MKPQYFGTYTPQDDNLTGFASNVTGATWTLSATTPNDSLAHLVTIRNDAATDHSGKTALLTGTDADGRAQTETMALPAGTATTTSTKYFKTLTSIVPSATIGGDTMDIGWKDTCITPMYPVNWRQGPPFSISVGVDISGTINYDVQHRFDNIWGSATTGQGDSGWFDHSSIAAKTADADGNYAYPITAARVLVNSLTAGATFTWYIIQGE